MKSEMPFLGVQKPGRTEIARIVFAAYPLDGFEDWRDTVLRLWREATYREERYLAIALARDRRYREHRTMAALPLYEELIVTGAWWDLVDEVAIRLVGELDLGSFLREWASDEDMWKRRTAIIAQIARKDGTDARAAVRLHRAQPRGPRVLHPQGDRLGAARVLQGRSGRRRALLRHPRAEPAEPPRGAEEARPDPLAVRSRPWPPRCTASSGTAVSSEDSAIRPCTRCSRCCTGSASATCARRWRWTSRSLRCRTSCRA